MGARLSARFGGGWVIFSCRLSFSPIPRLFNIRLASLRTLTDCSRFSASTRRGREAACLLQRARVPQTPQRTEIMALFLLSRPEERQEEEEEGRQRCFAPNCLHRLCCFCPPLLSVGTAALGVVGRGGSSRKYAKPAISVELKCTDRETGRTQIKGETRSINPKSFAPFSKRLKGGL